MNVKFVYEGKVSPTNDGEIEITIEMKSLPHAGDRIRLADGMTVEVTSITHLLGETEITALAMIKALP